MSALCTWLSSRITEPELVYGALILTAFVLPVGVVMLRDAWRVGE